MPVRKARKPSDIWVARSYEDTPVIIVECSYSGTLPPGVVLRNLRFEPVVDCRIAARNAKPRTVQAAMVRLTTEERDLHDYFLRAMEGVVTELPRMPAVGDLARSVDRVVEVFRCLTLPGSRSLQGLWAELFVIRQARDMRSAVQSWHTTNRSLFDFDSGAQAIEVKSASTGLRKHRFKLAQLQPPFGRMVYVASILLRESPTGGSVSDLWRYIEKRLRDAPALRSRLTEVIAQSIGQDWQHADSMRFDEAHAASTLAFFDARSLPRVGADAGPEISDIEFSADLSAATAMTSAAIGDAGGLVAALRN